MSKLERQLDQVYGESRVVVKWPADQEVDVEAVRTFLISEIDKHRLRVPLDLRSVEGAPSQLVKLLIECQVYARSNGKVVSISSAMPAMQDALSGRRHRRPSKVDQGDARESAESILEERRAREEPRAYDISKAERIVRPKKKQKRKSKTQAGKLQRVGVMAAIIFGATVSIAAVHWYLFDGDEKGVIKLPEKGFESDGQPVS